MTLRSHGMNAMRKAHNTSALRRCRFATKHTAWNLIMMKKFIDIEKAVAQRYFVQDRNAKKKVHGAMYNAAILTLAMSLQFGMPTAGHSLCLHYSLPSYFCNFNLSLWNRIIFTSSRDCTHNTLIATVQRAFYIIQPALD